MKTLQIIENGYRATAEEQDDTVVWFTHAMRGAGATLAVLLRGNAVNYAVAAQDASGLQVGDWRQSQPPRLAADIAGLMAKEVDVFALEDDLAERGIEREALVPGVRPVPRGQLGAFVAGFPRVWHW